MIPPNIGLISHKNWINLEAMLIASSAERTISNKFDAGTAYRYKGNGIWDIALDADVINTNPIGLGTKVIVKGTTFLNGIWKTLGCFAVATGGGISVQTNIKHYNQSWIENKANPTLTPYSDTPLFQTKSGRNVFNVNTALSDYAGDIVMETYYNTTEYFMLLDTDTSYNWTNLQFTGDGTGSAVVVLKKSIDGINWVNLVTPLSETINASKPSTIISLNEEAKGMWIKIKVTVSGDWDYCVKWKGII